MDINWNTLLSAAISTTPAVLTVIYSYRQRKSDNAYDIEKTKLLNEQKRIDNEYQNKTSEAEFQSQLDRLKMEQTHDNQLLKLEKSFDIASRNRELMSADLNSYIQALVQYFENPTSENLNFLVQSETKILLFLGPSDGLRLMEDRLILADDLNSDTLDSGYRTNPSGHEYTTYISMLGSVMRYKPELGLETYKD